MWSVHRNALVLNQVGEEVATERTNKIEDRQRSTLETEAHPGKARA